MDNQHRQIKGYRELTQGEIDLMNEIKSAGALLESIIRKVQEHIENQFEAAEHGADSIDPAAASLSIVELDRLEAADPVTWCTQAKHELQTGLMKLTRSVAQPGFF